MDPAVGGQFRVKRRRPYPITGYKDRSVAKSTQDSDLSTYAFDFRRTDEHAAERSTGAQVDIRFEAFALPAVRVSPDTDIQHPDSRLVTSDNVARQQDCSGARPEYRHSIGDAVADDVEQPESIAEHADGGAFAAGDDHRIRAPCLFRCPYRNRVHAMSRNGIDVLGEIALESEDSDAHRLPTAAGQPLLLAESC